MNLTLVFSRKYRWAEHYFSVWSLRNSQKLLTANQFLVTTIFFVITNISFFSLRFDLFSIIADLIDNQEQCSLCRSLPCFLVLLCSHCGPLQYFSTYFRKLKEIGVLRPIFPDYVISCDYGYDNLTCICIKDQKVELKELRNYNRNLIHGFTISFPFRKLHVFYF